MDASVGSTAFLLRQFFGERAVRVTPILPSDYEMDDPAVVDRLNNLAVEFSQTGLSSIRQPDGTEVDLNAWLLRHWYLVVDEDVHTPSRRA